MDSPLRPAGGPALCVGSGAKGEQVHMAAEGAAGDGPGAGAKGLAAGPQHGGGRGRSMNPKCRSHGRHLGGWGPASLFSSHHHPLQKEPTRKEGRWAQR